MKYDRLIFSDDRCGDIIYEIWQVFLFKIQNFIDLQFDLKNNKGKKN